MGGGLGGEVELAVVLGDVDHCECSVCVVMRGRGKTRDGVWLNTGVRMPGPCFCGPVVAAWNGRVEVARHRRQALPIRALFKCFGHLRLIQPCNERVMDSGMC